MTTSQQRPTALQRLSWLACICVLACLTLGAALLPSPLVVSGGETYGRLIMAAAVAGVGAAAAFGWYVAGLSWCCRNAVSLTALTAVLLGVYVVLSFLVDTAVLPAMLTALAAIFAVFSFAALCRFDKCIPASGPLSLLLFLGTCCCLEICLQSMSTDRLVAHVAHTPLLAQRDRIETVYEKNGFRGKRPCRACPENTIRIVSMGGSSTYGLPMASGAFTYASELQRLLVERRPEERYEVLNAGVAGAGLTQILHGLRHTVLPLKPDIVSVCAWFNDNANAPGWYGVPGKSDFEAYKQLWVLWKLQELPGYRELHRTRLFGLFRHYLLSMAAHFPRAPIETPKNLKRMSPAEFREGLQEFIALSEQYEFLPVFILEPLNRPAPFEQSKRNNQYYAVMLKLAEEHSVPVVNAPELFREHSGEWLFFDFIHPNAAGHRLVAEGLYATLFNNPQSARVRTALERRGIDLGFPALRRAPVRRLPRDGDLPQAVEVRAAAPLSNDKQELALEVRARGEMLALLPGLSQTRKRFSIPLPNYLSEVPLVDLAFRARLEISPTRHPELEVGTTGVFSPVHIDLTSGGKDYGWQVRVGVSGVRVDSDSRGYNVAVISSRSGEVLATQSFDVFAEPAEFSRMIGFFNSAGSYAEAGAPPIVVVAVKTDGALNTRSKDLADALQSIGGSGDRPGLYESFALIGTPGAAPGSGLEASGKQLVRLQIGDERLSRATLLSLGELQVRG